MQGKLTLQADPQIYAKGLPFKGDRLRALALDLASKCGVAMIDYEPGKLLENAMFYMDLWDLSIGSFDSSIARYLRLRAFLEAVQPDVIFFEEVKFTAPQNVGGKKVSMNGMVARATSSISFQAALTTVVVMWAEDNGVPCVGFNSKHIKQMGTGKGNAGKEAMILACNEKYGTDFDPDTYAKTGVDNLADAAHLLELGLTNYSKGVA